MKKLLLYILPLALAAFGSCERYLDVEPTNVVTLTTCDDVKALMGAYIRSFTTTGNNLDGVAIPYRNSQNHLMFAIYADELDTDNFLNNNFARNETLLYRESLNWMNRNFTGTIWSDYFGAIGFLNTVIDALDHVEGGTRQERDIVRCEAQVLRAWYLFKLQQYYSPYKRNDLGIPFNLDSETVGDYAGGRKTQTEVYAAIIGQLKEALACETPPKSTYNIFYDRKIINALLAQVYLFKGGSGAGETGDYTNAIGHATAAMEGRSLMGLDDYEPFATFGWNTYGIFKDKPQALLTTITYNMNGMYAGMSNRNNNPQYAREAAYALYPADDVRRDKFFRDVMDGSQRRRAVAKYDEVTSAGSNQVLIFNFFSIADMHLTVAESYARMGDEANARKWLEDFQRKRIRNHTPYAGSDLLGEIVDERRREFFMEFDSRWVDLIRRNEAWTRKSDGTDPNVATYSISVDDFRYCLPIPLTQETAHSRVEQNPGWGL
jgi:hypothetical protein